MKNLILSLLFLVVLAVSGTNAQKASTQVIYTSGVPASCVAGRVYIDRSTGNLYTFKTAVGCTLIGGGATGLSEAQVQALIDETLTSQGQDNFLIQGGNVAYVSGLTFRVSAAIYYIKGVRYTSTEQTVTLPDADATNPRIDVIYLDTTGTVDDLSGTAAVDPSEPTLDPTTQLKLTTVLINAGEATPVGISATDVYKENTEWEATTNQAGQVNFDGLTNPRTGTKAAVVTSGANNTYLNFDAEATEGTIAIGGGQFVLYIRPSASWGNKSLIARLYFGSTARGQGVVIDDGLLGFNSSTVAYQQVVIPDSAFQVPSNQTVDSIRFTIAGGGGAISFNIDDITWQRGLGTSTSAFFNLTTKNHVPMSDGTNLINSGIAYDATGTTLNVNVPNNVLLLGDTDEVANGTFISIDDGNNYIDIDPASGQVHIGTNPYQIRVDVGSQFISLDAGTEATLAINGGATNNIELTAANGVQYSAADSASLSASNTGKIRFNSTTDRFQFSENGGIFTDFAIPSDIAYDATTWDGNLDVPTKNAVRDKFESLSAGDGFTEVVKLADQTVTNNATPQADTELFFTMAAGGIYEVHYTILYSGNNSTGDYRWHFAYATSLADASHSLGTVAEFSGGDSAQSTTVGGLTQWPSGDRIPGVLADDSIRQTFGRITINNTSGGSNLVTFKFSNAAASSGRTSTTRAGSRIRYKRLN